jgi:peroxiredoxin/mono/diheme cytochrome c family protein
MKLRFLSLILLLTATVAWAADKTSVIGRQIESFELNDIQGQPHKLDDWKDSPVLVAVFLGTECPLAKQYAPRLQELADKYADKKVALLVVSSNQQDSITELTHFARTSGLKGPILKDLGNKVADQFGAERTPEAFVLDADRKIAYRGRIDDQFTYGRQKPKVSRQYVAEAIDALLAGKAVETPETEAHGCHIGRVLTPQADSPVTYSNQIARIFQEHCVQCHRPGEIGPFSLTNYEEVVGWAEMIREVVSEQRMPPWHADPKHGKFANDWRLSDEQKQQIYDWVDAGAPEGDKSQLPPPRKFVEGWQIGEPDDVFYIADKPFNVPESGEVRYQYFTVDPGFTEDKWIASAECRPGNRGVVHHIIVGLVPPGGDRKNIGGLHSEWLTATAPGGQPLILKEGYAKLIPAGSKLVFQMHYTPNGKATTDRSCVGFKYADPTTVKKVVGTDKAATNQFVIPPGDANYPVEAKHRFDQDTELLAMFPHMHLRGKSFRYTLIYPDQRREVLLNVPHYDFNWQNGYVPAEKKIIPAGSVMHCEATFDNSEHNLANPDPTKAVRWGDQTWEEMMIGYFDVALVDQDLTKKPERRTDVFLKKGAEATLSDELKAKATDSLESSEKLGAFGLELRKQVPQLDRICWTTLVDGKVKVQCVAQEKETGRSIPAGNAGREVGATLSKLATVAASKEPRVHKNLKKETSLDLRYMSQVFGSSLHVPVKHAGKTGSVNFWSSEADAFPPEAVKLLTEAAQALAE